MSKSTKLWLALAALTVLVPLGLLSDASAWGEWETDYYREILGFIPRGIENALSWKAPIPDYELPGLGATASYYLSAAVGIAAIYGIFWLMSRRGSGQKR
ncbi:PDGLE domain-containing protein [Nitratifractor sp.]